MKTQQKAGFYGWINAGLLFFIYFAASGLVYYGFSVIFPAMINANGWSRGEASIAQTISTIMIGFLYPLTAVILYKIGSRKTIIMGLVVMVAGLGLLGTITTELWQWTLLWGVVIPIGFVFGGLLPIQFTIVYWFNAKRATALGIVMTGAALGGFIAQPLFTWLIQLTKLWQAGWMAAGGIVILALVSSFFVHSRPEDLGQYPDGIVPDEAGASGDGMKKIMRTYRTSESWTLNDILRTPTIWCLLVVGIAHDMPIVMVITHGVLHFMDLGFSRMEAASVLSLIILGSGIARFPMGWLGDRIEPRWIITASMALMFLSLTGIWLAPSLPVLIFAGLIFGIGYGTILVMFPVILGNYFGPECFAGVNGFLVFFLIIFSATVPVGGGFIADKMGNYNPAFMVLTALLIIGVVISLLLAPPKIKRKRGKV